LYLADHVAAHESAYGPKRTRRPATFAAAFGGKADTALAPFEKAATSGRRVYCDGGSQKSQGLKRRERAIILLTRRAADQRIVHAIVEATNSSAVKSLLVDFEIGSRKKFRGKPFDRKPDCIRRVFKPSVPSRSSPGFVISTGKEFRFSVIIEPSRGCLFDRSLSGHCLFEHDFPVVHLKSLQKVREIPLSIHQRSDVTYICSKCAKVSHAAQLLSGRLTTLNSASDAVGHLHPARERHGMGCQEPVLHSTLLQCMSLLMAQSGHAHR
jgi:hypothetical protein